MEVRVKREDLIAYISEIFVAKGLNAADAGIIADVLVAADSRGIPSHGIGRLWRYLAGIDKGVMKLDAIPEPVYDTSVSLVVDAKGVMGPPVSYRTMKATIEKAEESGLAFSCVRDSNHFGIAGYYAMMAMDSDMIGFCMTNTAALGVPTFGRNVMFGTNPLAVAVPSLTEIPYVLDMSTTVVSRGKIEVYERNGEELPAGWAVNEKGLSAVEPGPLLENMLFRRGGGIMPLGGEGEAFGGYKGYGLALFVDIMTAVLSGADFGPDVADSQETSARVSHFFGAMKISRFREVESFKSDMDKMLRQLKKSQPAEGQTRVYYPGLKEAENEINAASKGVLLSKKIWASVTGFGDGLNVKRPKII